MRIIKLYAIKCLEGYLKKTPDGFEYVGLNKASVYNNKDSPELSELHQLASKAGASQIRIVELDIIEKDPLNIC